MEKLCLRLCARGRDNGVFLQAGLVAAAWTSSFQKPTGPTVITKMIQEALNGHLFTGVAVDNIEEDMVIEGLQEEFELEGGPPVKQEFLVTVLTKKSKPDVSTVFKEALKSIKECERDSQDRQLLIFKLLFRVF